MITATHLPTDEDVVVVLLDPPFAYGRQALVEHPSRGRIRLPLRDLRVPCDECGGEGFVESSTAPAGCESRCYGCGGAGATALG